MKVRAFSTHSKPEWRWRIVDNDGATVEESPNAFRTIAAAITDGNDRIWELSVTPPEGGAP